MIAAMRTTLAFVLTACSTAPELAPCAAGTSPIIWSDVSGIVDDFIPGDSAVTIAFRHQVTLTGINPGGVDVNDNSVNGRVLMLWNCSDAPDYLQFEHAHSMAWARFNSKTDIKIPPRFAELVIYDSEEARWHPIQGRLSTTGAP